MKLIDKKEFDKLSKLEKRVAICKDVLLRIENKKIKSITGNFWGKSNRYNILDNLLEDVNLQNKINENTCEVCAKGAIFTSWVGNFNEIKEIPSSNIHFWNNDLDELKSIFGHELLDLIEVCFEQTEQYYKCYETDINFDSYIDYFRQYEDLNKRLIAIMKNIISNKGELKLNE